MIVLYFALKFVGLSQIVTGCFFTWKNFKVLLENQENPSKNLVPKECVSSHSHMNETKTFKHKKVFKYVGLLLNLMAVPYFYNSHFVSPDYCLHFWVKFKMATRGPERVTSQVF